MHIVSVINGIVWRIDLFFFFIIIILQGALMKDVLNMAGYQIPKNEQISGNGACNKKYDSIAHNYRLYSTALNLREKMKQNEINAMETRDEYLDGILRNLTRDDLRQLIRYEDELSQADNFEILFPTSSSYLYFKFFEVERYYDRLLDAWEHRYSGNKTKGIRRLQQHCETMKHLKQNFNRIWVSSSVCAPAWKWSCCVQY